MPYKMKKNTLLLFIFLQINLYSQTTPTGNSPETGVTQGNLNVSLTGAASYDIPIAVPPGINNVTPKVGLSYSSQGSNGVAGYGWNISGLSAITRIPGTNFHDGNIDPVDYDNLDRFALDGQRLIVKKGTTGVYGANNTVYETENFSNVIITSYGVNAAGANYGPAYFQVHYPDGSSATYECIRGQSPSIGSFNIWAITKWEQSYQGIKILYSYSLVNNDLNITSIKYGGISDAPINEIKFVYKTRQRIEQFYVGGLSTAISNILSEVQVTGNGIGYRNYSLAYEITPLGYERLTKITENSGDNSKSYNPTIFSYNDYDTPLLLDKSMYVNIDRKIVRTESRVVTGDFDGDNKSDFVSFSSSGRDNKFWLNKDLKEGFTNISLSQTVGGTIADIFPTTLLVGDSMVGYKLDDKESITVVDTRRVLVSNNIPLTYTDKIYFSSYSNSLNSIILMQQKEITDPDPNYKKSYIYGDFNNDGSTDILMFAYSQAISLTPLAVKVYLIDLRKDITSGFLRYCGQINGLDMVNRSKDIKPLDFNGDGKLDFLVFNGDYASSGVYTFGARVYTIEGSSLGLLTSINYPFIVGNIALVGDYNGDGKSDFVSPSVGSGNDNWNFFMSTGNSYVIINKPIGVKFYNNNTNIVENIYENYLSNPLTVMQEKWDILETNYVANDFNGDGKTDILAQSNIVHNYTKTRTRLSNGTLTDFVVDTRDQGTSIDNKAKLLGNKSVTTNDIVFMQQANVNLAAVGLGAIPLITNINKSNYNFDYAFVYDKTIFNFSSSRNFRNDALLKKITTGNGVAETITYKPLVQEVNTSFSIYTPNNNENYPNVSIKMAPGFKVVSMVEVQSSTDYKKQLYAYHGAVSNINGLGFLGFKATMKTNWFENETQIISNISKFDINMRGANIENYSLLSLISPTFNINPSTFITKSIVTYNAYSDAFQTNKVFKLKKLNVKNFDGLNGTNLETTFTYDVYNNLLTENGTTKEGSAIV
jgi:Salmonella virulence plasmid 65kDa B protein/Insecticide toxin TcdB middle/N-terminal region